MNKSARCFLVFLALSFHLDLSAQNHMCCKPQQTLHFGYSLISQHLQNDLVYRPFIFLFHRTIPLTKKNENGILSLYYEPQLNPVVFDKELHVEFGLNAGVMFDLKISETLTSYILLGSGPHFISTSTDRQAGGFIFSDNIAAGIKKKFQDRSGTALNLQCRLRHISNAGLKDPNGGMNNAFLILGLTKEVNKP